MAKDEYIVERIDDDRKKGNKTEYLVKWEGYPTEQNTWEPASSLKNNIALKKYLASKPKQQQQPTPIRKTALKSGDGLVSKAKVQSTNANSPKKVAFAKMPSTSKVTLKSPTKWPATTASTSASGLSSPPNRSPNRSITLPTSSSSSSSSSSSVQSVHSAGTPSTPSSRSSEWPDISVQTSYDLRKGIIVNIVSINGITREVKAYFNPNSFKPRNNK